MKIYIVHAGISCEPNIDNETRAFSTPEKALAYANKQDARIVYFYVLEYDLDSETTDPLEIK